MLEFRNSQSCTTDPDRKCVREEKKCPKNHQGNTAFHLQDQKYTVQEVNTTDSSARTGYD